MNRFSSLLTYENKTSKKKSSPLVGEENRLKSYNSTFATLNQTKRLLNSGHNI